MRPAVRAALLLVSIFIAGTIGFLIIGGAKHTLLDAIYMTTITLTTVGFEEAIRINDRPGAQIFTVLLLLFGTGTFVYFFSNLTAFLVEGTLGRVFWRRRMIRKIDQIRDHVVVCGAGHTGEHVVRELHETGRPFVVVDPNEDRIRELQARFGGEFPAVVGDATDDEVLTAAGLPQARGLVACVSADKDNVLVTFTARSLNPRARIVARCRDIRTEAKLIRAGADAVVSPDRIGGLRLASEMLRPTVVSFLDIMLRDTDRRWRVEEVTVGAGSQLDGLTVESLHGRKIADCVVLALHSPDGNWLYNPGADLVLRPNTGIVFMGSPDARASLEHAARATL
ncbi:MAG: Potassium channel protein [Deltaproteobacteria bacterium]|nr:Potassium channel protein [Deltaproteobacteria bacterium]